MFERFTEKAIKVIMLAQEEARRLGHNFVGTEQLLLGLIAERSGLASRVLISSGITLKEARIETEKIIARGSGFVAIEIPFTPRAKRALELSWASARQLDHNYIGTEHLLLGLLDEGEGVAIQVIEKLGGNVSTLRALVLSELGKLVGEYKVPRADNWSEKDFHLLTDVLNYAHRTARERSKNIIEMEDVLIGILMADETVASKALSASGVDVSNLSRQIELHQPHSEASSVKGEMPLSDPVQKWLARAVLLSQDSKHPPTSLLLLDLLEPGRLRALKILDELGVDLELLRNEIGSEA